MYVVSEPVQNLWKMKGKKNQRHKQLEVPKRVIFQKLNVWQLICLFSNTKSKQAQLITDKMQID